MSTFRSTRASAQGSVFRQLRTLVIRALPPTLLATALVACLVGGWLAAPAFGQAQSGNLYGTVTDLAGTPLPGVTVTVTGASSHVAVTDADGEFRLLGLSPSSYDLTAELDGFSTIEYPDISLSVGRNTTLTVQMSTAVEETITVTSESPLLDSRKITAGSTVTALELEKIPTSRDPWAILQTVPGVQVDRINVGGNESGQQSQYVGPGSSGDEAVWAVDGVVVTDMGAIGSSPTYYNFDAFQEMQAATGGSDATLATAGVTLNMVTKRGGNEWKGSGRWVMADDAWQSDLDFDPNDLADGQEEFSQGNAIVSIDDYGFEIGGPIIEDKLWIWANYGVQDIELLTLLGGPDNTELDTYGAKLNAQPTASNSMVGFYNFGDKVKIGRNAGPTRPPATTWNQTGPTDIYKLEDTHVFSSSFFLTGLASYVGGGFELTPQGGLDGPEAVWDENFVFQENYLHHETDRPQEQVKLDASYFFDTGSVGHELKFGAGYRTAELKSASIWPNDALRLDFYTSYGFPYNVVQIARPRVEDLETEYTSVYAQDTLTTGNLTANVGLRYDLQDGRLNGAEVPAVSGFETLPDGTPLLPAARGVATDQGFEWENLTPRLGLTYALGAERRTLLRASYAQFAQQLNQALTTQVSTSTASYAYFYYEDRNGDGRTTPDEIVDFEDGPLFTNLYDPAYQTTNNRVDPDFEAQVTDELILALEHAVRPELLVSLTATMRNIDNFGEQVHLVCGNGVPCGDPRLARQSDYELAGTLETTRPDGSTRSVPHYQLADGLTDTGLYLTNGNDEQKYLGFTLSVNKRLANRWMLRGNFTVSDWEWDVPPVGQRVDPDPSEYLGSARDGDPVLQGSGTGSGSKGGVYINSSWSYSLTGMYQVAPDRAWGFNVAASLNGREGYAVPYFARGPNTFATLASTLHSYYAVDTADEFRLDDIHLLDLRVEKVFDVQDFSFTLGAEVFNVTNEATVLQRRHRLGIAPTNFVTEIVSPRVARLSLRFSF